MYQRPWAQPRSLHELVDDLAAKVASGELLVYLEDSPLWHHRSSGYGESGSPGNVGKGDHFDTARIQGLSYMPHPEVKQPKVGDRIFKRVHQDGHDDDKYTLGPDGRPMGAEEGVMPPELFSMDKPPPNHDRLVKEGWPTLIYNRGPAYKTFVAAEPVELAPGTKLYRLVDEKNPDAGGFWALKLPDSKTRWRRDYAVKDSWNDDGYYVEHVVGPEGLKAWKGPAAGQRYQKHNGKNFYLSGGEVQLFITPGSVDTAPPQLTEWPET